MPVEFPSRSLDHHVTDSMFDEYPELKIEHFHGPLMGPFGDVGGRWGGGKGAPFLEAGDIAAQELRAAGRIFIGAGHTSRQEQRTVHPRTRSSACSVHALASDQQSRLGRIRLCGEASSLRSVNRRVETTSIEERESMAHPCASRESREWPILGASQAFLLHGKTPPPCAGDHLAGSKGYRAGPVPARWRAATTAKPC